MLFNRFNYICGDADDGRQDISRYYSDKIVDISVNYGLYIYSSQDTIHYFSRNIVETFDGYCTVGYRFNTTHSYSHNSVGHGIFLRVYVASHRVHCSLHENVRIYSRGDYGRGLISFQYTSHYYLHNYIECVDGRGKI